MLERFSQCLHAWMEAEDISTAAVTRLLNYKSKTSILRALRGESNYAAYQRMYDLLSGDLSPAWQERFRAALTVERIGASRAAVFEALDHQLFNGSEMSSSVAPLPIPPGANSGHLMIFGFSNPGLYGMLDQFLSSGKDVSVNHYMTADELQNNPDLLTGLIGHISSVRYHALLMPLDSSEIKSLTWNVMLYLPVSGNDVWCLLSGIQKPVWLRMESAIDNMRTLADRINDLKLTQLYRFDELKNGTDYIRFTEDAFRIERGRAAVIMKPTPGMQMLPAQAVESTFKDYLAENTEPVAAMREKLISIFEKRVNNFYHRNKPTLLYFSMRAMTEFARTGILSDQFFAFRPYTVQERIMCLEALQAFTKREDVHLNLRNGPVWPVSFESYTGSGVLLYPSKTSYNSLYSAYRELFLPGEALSELFRQYAEEYLFNACNNENTQIERVIAAAQAAE